MLLAAAAGAGLVITAAPADAAPAELSFGAYAPVDASRYQSLRYADDGRYFFAAGQWRCQIARPGSVACKGRPATAPRGTQGVAITNDAQGPWWVPPGTTFRFTSRAGFRAPVLGVGKRITVNNVACAVPAPNVVSCATPNRAFVLRKGSHRFYFPPGDRAHSPNPR